MTDPKNEKKLEFVSDAFYNDELVHKKGEKKWLDNSLLMADRWIKRGIAIDISDVKEDSKAKKQAEDRAKLEAEEKAKKEAEEKQKAADAEAEKLKNIANAQSPANNKGKDIL